MARKPRSFSGDHIYHIMNRASARAKIFLDDSDYHTFESTLEQAVQKFNLRLLTYIIMPNHFHLVLWPRKTEAEKISLFMKWLQQTHTQRYHARHKITGEGRLYQGRFKAFPIQAGFSDFQFLRKTCRYVERNALRANLVHSAEQWKFSALHRRLHASPESQKFLAPWPENAYPGNAKWLDSLNTPMSPAEEKALAQSFRRGSPFGAPAWRSTTASALNLEHTLRPPGRPKKTPKNNV